MNYQDQSYSVWSMMKMSHDNDVTNCISPFHAKNKTKLLCLIRQGMVYDLDHTRQQCD